MAVPLAVKIKVTSVTLTYYIPYAGVVNIK